MVEKIKEYFIENVRLADEFETILIDFLGNEAITYTIEPVPVEPIVRQYTDGGSLRQFVFQFGSREYYDNGVAQNIENLDFYEKFKDESMDGDDTDGRLCHISTGPSPRE